MLLATLAEYYGGGNRLNIGLMNREGKMRLFVAFNISAEVQRQIMVHQPPADEHIRPIDPGLMHVTLKFIGEANPAQIHGALQGLVNNRFESRLQSTGCFRLSGHRKILWLGVTGSEGLTNLHEAIDCALQPIGVDVETREYRSHLTLARCKGASAESIQFFLEANVCSRFFTVNEFILFSSEFIDGTLHYRQLNKYYLF